ncbi:hypothetical protein L248_1185 [Schleiferilactobacillus shenzhenensis LY-73]|uniref:Uncharacterized protein n=1 Tax=Schleiferilactobacillus shenzhenensis LY-73 TaxID=1231336 RepID=U4TXL5_9LACO|nr:hypothetical protein L248_1185 [Schleiferilactobacillus shenzhenensis LY-73]
MFAIFFHYTPRVLGAKGRKAAAAAKKPAVLGVMPPLPSVRRCCKNG